MKKENMHAVIVRHTTGQKIGGVLALITLFVCGVMVGVAINGRSRAFKPQEPRIQQAAGDTSDMETCQVIESMMLERLAPEDDYNPESHDSNIEIYTNLIKYGCPENGEKYRALIQREQDILTAMTDREAVVEKTCEEIEGLLIGKMPYGSDDSGIRIERAKIYANLSERGCPENSAHYVDLAAKELEIARALDDDNFTQNETVEIVETYKRLEMKQAAMDVLNKVQQLTDPAIDFIIRLQQIINE